ncbi:phenylacetate--CoA ligase family protein [Dehalogenimonas alkenigignens]|uniref:Coenzyme F390 synthetase n=1 Tax=Dehalogenimonas alkenigignens TaxID=1217799 RepID=A0A0W0GIV3_9CHLR|nr:AMP-binding protein [Dehalogenimonas alkenigignens]KTB48450.1 Coenzyme F390 synthetase [Dehalogenimonas alkenigignens]PVV85097.1 phenylacetate--CoA ligase family protein [Dehalogenimonas alkenigignens]
MTVTKTDLHYDKLESMTASERQAYLDARLVKAVARAYRGAPGAREMLNQAGVKPSQIKTAADLEKLPITRKTDLIEKQKQNPPYGGYYIGQLEEIERVFISPGPVYEPLHSSRIKWFARSFWAAGFRRGDVAINTFTYHLSPAGTLFGEALRHCGATVVVAGAGNTEIHLRTMKDLGVTGFVGTPSYLMGLINKIEETGGNFRKDFKVNKAWFTGEMLSPSVRRILEQDYCVDTRQAYAVTEPGGALAYECSQKSGLHLMDDYLIEIVDPATGKQMLPGDVGEVVVTPLHNPHWGLLRFGTGDLSRLVTDKCACGRTAPKLAGLLGRTGEAVKVRGMFIVPKQVEAALAAVDHAGKFQIIVRRESNRDLMTLRLELKPGTIDSNELRQRIGQAFQNACVVKLDHLELAPAGSIPTDAKTVVDERKWD